jgi:hypothetical protein
VIGAVSCAGNEEGESDVTVEGNVEQGGYLTSGHWQLDVGFRHQYSHRHFIGTVEQVQRAREHTEVINQINLTNLVLTYQKSPRWSFQANVPVLIASRHSQDTPDLVYHSRGIGDIIVSAQTWLFRPPTESRANVAVGFGVVVPSGDPSVVNLVNTGKGNQAVVVDQSIQLGQGGWGILASMQAFKAVKKAVLFTDCSYTITPQDTNGVHTGRRLPLEAIMSISDLYLAEAGVAYPFPRVRGLAVNLGGRVEGVPVRDLIGRSDGFRRPGFAVSVFPGFEYSKGRTTWTFNLPIAVLRDRPRSVPDLLDGHHGDAAFADVLWLLDYTYRF